MWKAIKICYENGSPTAKEPKELQKNEASSDRDSTNRFHEQTSSTTSLLLFNDISEAFMLNVGENYFEPLK